MAKKKTLDQKIDALTTIVQNGFAAVATDMAELRHELKGDIAAVRDQVNSIERQLHNTRIETRLSDLEEKVFGAPRG